MKKTMMKSVLAAAMLAGAVVGQGSVSNAAGTTPAVAAATAAPIMRDNLAKYGLVKDVELPVTVTAGGLSYTLEKIMIYDINSTDAQSLIKKYNYWNLNSFGDSKYLLWTKITITNKTNKIVQRSTKDLNYKWYLNTAKPGANGGAHTLFSGLKEHEMNSKETLLNFVLNPGNSLTTYQALSTKVKPTLFSISLSFNGVSKFIFIANSADGE